MITPANRHATRTLALFCLIATAAPAVAASPLEPQLDEDDNYSETITGIADLEDGTYVQVQLNISNLGPGDYKGACRMLVVEPGQKPWSAADRVGRDEWSATAEQFTVTTCSMVTGGSVTSFDGKLDKGSVRVIFASGLQQRVPPDSKVTIEGRTFTSYPIIAWARVEATLAVPGRGVRTVSGFGYMDHSRSTTLPKQIASRWVRFRGLGDGDSVLLLARNLPDGGLRGWVWREQEPFPRPLSKLKLTRVDDKDQAKGYVIEGAAGDLTFEIKVESQIYRYAPVEEYGFLGVLARSVVGNPVTRTYRAAVSMTDAAAPSAVAKRGILEVAHVQ